MLYDRNHQKHDHVTQFIELGTLLTMCVLNPTKHIEADNGTRKRSRHMEQFSVEPEGQVDIVFLFFSFFSPHHSPPKDSRLGYSGTNARHRQVKFSAQNENLKH